MSEDHNPPDAAQIRFRVDPADVPPEKAARRLHLSLEQFTAVLPRLIARAFMHAMGTGYTSVENAVERILDILGETPPSGKDRHKALIDRVSRPLTGSIARPALFDEEMRSDLLECMRMRHRVYHSDYDEFVPRKAEPPVEAAKRIISRIRPAIAAFKKKVDPEPGEENDGGDGAGGGASGGPPV